MVSNNHLKSGVDPLSSQGDAASSQTEQISLKFRYALSSSRDDKRYICYTCGKRCGYPSELKNHMLAHTGEKPFPCDKCDYKAKSRSVLKTHMKIHADDKPCKCDTCGYKCCHPIVLQAHIRKNHPATNQLSSNDNKLGDPNAASVSNSETSPYRCNLCDQEFKCKSSRDTHLKTHCGERRFKCQFCGKEFKKPDKLSYHILVHIGEKKFSCTECPFRSYRADSLRAHMLSKSHGAVRAREKPYACCLCEKRFISPWHLSRHETTHSRKGR